MIKGFSRLTTDQKKEIVSDRVVSGNSRELIRKDALINKSLQTDIERLSENVISTFPLPYSVTPNFLINDKEYIVPMVTEESSVVAAAAKSASFWYNRGGYSTEIIGLVKKGQIHFTFEGDFKALEELYVNYKYKLIDAVSDIDAGMKKRGGGIKDIEFIDKQNSLENYGQLEVDFDTCDAMGANYMNSCLEGMAHELLQIMNASELPSKESFQVIMSILSNYSPENSVKVLNKCKVKDLGDGKMEMDARQFAEKFVQAVSIAKIDVSRAVTHNKGFYNGIDAVALATGNDWRAIEANGHAYCSRNGSYSSISSASIVDDDFIFEATVPLQVGTVGGITSVHPMVDVSLQVLGNPGAAELMKVMASVGLASNFAAVKSLITTGIQKGHMQMHLSNILQSLLASPSEISEATAYFEDKVVSHSAVVQFLKSLR